MSITVQSTTDSPEVVTTVMADLAKGKVEKPAAETVSAASEEKLEASGTSEEESGTEADAEESSEDESNEQDSDDSSKEEKAKKKGGFKKRIDKLTRKISEKDQQIAYWQNEAQKKSQVDAKETAKVSETKLADKAGKPRADDFNSHDDYVEALTDWKLERKLTEKETTAKSETLKKEQQSRIETHVERVKSYAKENKDFNDAMLEVDDIPMSLAVQELILDAENGPKLMHELAKHREEFEKICNMSPLRAAAELGKFEAKYLPIDSSKTTETKTSKAPAPIKPIGSKSSASVKKDIYDPNLSQREFEKMREEQLRARRA